MSDDNKTVAKLVGGVAGAAGGALLAEELHKRRFLSQIADKKSQFHENYHNLTEFLSEAAEEPGSVDELIRKQSGKPMRLERTIHRARDYVQKYEDLMKDVAKLENSNTYKTELAKFKASPKYQEFLESNTALDTICNRPEKIQAIHFRTHAGKPVTEVVMYTSNLSNSVFSDTLRLSEEAVEHLPADDMGKAITHRLHGVGPGTLPTYTDGGVTKLQVQEIEGLSNHAWFKEAEKTVAAAEAKFSQNYRAILKKAAPESWLKEKAGKAPMGMVVSAALIGAVVVGGIAGLLVGNGSHRRRELESQAGKQPQPGIPGL